MEVKQKMKLSLRSVQRVILPAVAVLLSGCSMMNIGAEDYGCPGLPNGVQCMSARDVYVATNNGQVPAPMVRGREAEQHEAEMVHKTGVGKSNESGVKQASPNDVVDNYVAPRLPDRPVPIRTPAQVMRIWVAPWEDSNGDLNTTGYIYTEIEPRRWVVGEPMMASDPVLRPLQSLDAPTTGIGNTAMSAEREARLERQREEREIRQEQIQQQREIASQKRNRLN
ncbi:hypothetical protein P608_10075 [Comamonas thiooxydans]|uniref:Type IV conjugative transfer system lipoprotein TraV n=1 Tax=Comamonas thiooxydans TaxID=363952 RepID=A0A0E3BV56_9BURK|nr:hypothetical protein P608_10075 [Comamonas thiooxydans]KGH17188.1 hypothetical protein P607_18160 [Comamonas thiooxydans]